MLLQEGSTVKEKYLVERYLGEGAFAEVYRVKHRFLGRQALKIFKAPSITLEEIEQSLAEAQLLSKIGHPNIVRVFDAATLQTDIGECGYFTMEYVPGGSLDSFWQSFGKQMMPVGLCVNIAKQICEGLSIAHSESPPIIHRDIKPQNILVGYDKENLRVRISDFGLAKRVNPLTLLASAQGTIGFKPPEFLNDLDSCAGDIWAIGSVLYLLLTDKMPFKTGHSGDESYNTSYWSKPLRPPSLYNINIDSELDRIIFKTLMIDTEERYRDANDMLKDLKKWRDIKDKQQFVNGFESDNNKKSKQHEKENFVIPEALNGDIDRIIKLSQKTGKLNKAADQLGQLIDQYPSLNEQYGYLLSLWKRGIIM